MQDFFTYLDVLVFVEGVLGAHPYAVRFIKVFLPSAIGNFTDHHWLTTCCAGTIYAMDEENECLAAEGRIDAGHMLQGMPLLLQGGSSAAPPPRLSLCQGSACC